MRPGERSAETTMLGDVLHLPWESLVWGGSYRGGKEHAWLMNGATFGWRVPLCGMPDERRTLPIDTKSQERCLVCMARAEHVATAYQEAKRKIAMRFPRAYPEGALCHAVMGMRMPAVAAAVFDRLKDAELVFEYTSGSRTSYTARSALREEFGRRFSM